MNRSVIIVEDDADLRESTVEFLCLQGFEVTGVGSGLEFYQALAKLTYAVVVLDLGLPDQSGYVLAEYVSSNTSMGIIILTARGEQEDRLKGYESGADVYLVKPVDCRELVLAIRNLCSRIDNSIDKKTPDIKENSWQINSESWLLLTPTGTKIYLTAKEMQFTSILAKSPGSMVSRDFILKELGYDDTEYANRAMDSLVRRLRRKIEAQINSPTPIKTAYTAGYCFSAPIMIT